MGNLHMHKTQMQAQIPAHWGAAALFMSPALTLCAGMSLVYLLQYNINILELFYI